MSSNVIEVIGVIIGVLTLVVTSYELIIKVRGGGGKINKSRKRLPKIAVVLCQELKSIAADVFLPDVLEGIQEVAERAGFDVIVKSKYHPMFTEERIMESIQDRDIRGIIISGPQTEDQNLINKIYCRGKQRSPSDEKPYPLLLLGSLEDYPKVDVNNKEAAKVAVLHMIEDGYKKIGMITNAPRTYTASSARCAGYQSAIEKASEGNPDYIFNDKLIIEGNYTSESGYNAMKILLERANNIDAVFVASDVVAFGAMQFLEENNIKIGKDIALIGFDDAPLSKFVDPPLTTIRIPARKQGKTAAQRLVKAIKNNERVKSDNIDTTLIKRASCKCDKWRDDPI